VYRFIPEFLSWSGFLLMRLRGLSALTRFLYLRLLQKAGAAPLQEELHSPLHGEKVKRVLSIPLRRLRIMQWSFHIRRPNYHAQKTLVKRMLRGAWHGIDCANFCNFGSLIAEGDRG
jgi:hypothetical protein